MSPSPTGTPFGFKTAWLAVRGAESASVAGALGLADASPATWDEGVRLSYDDRNGVFVSPRTGGWVFAVGLADPPDLANLSRRLGTEVQHFGTHRVTEWHTWSLARDGELVRSLEYVGDEGRASAHGEATEIERELGFDWVVPRGAEPPDDADFPDEESVMQVAAAWSIDPQTLDRVPSEGETGTFGVLPRR